MAHFSEKESAFKDLKKLVNDYLSSASMQTVGPYQIYLKSAFIICSWILLYTLLLSLGPSYPILAIACLLALLFFTCGLEFCIMHDASHGAYSTQRWLNKFALNFTLGVLGGCSVSWHQEHVVRHHGFTNILGSDPDVYASHVLRLHPGDQWHWWQRWQHYYAIPLYSFMWLHWFFTDIINATFNTYKLSPKKYWLFWMQIFIGIVPHVILGIVLPYAAFQNLFLVLTAYCAFFMTLSIIMAMTFVLAHVSEGQVFYEASEVVRKDWAIHQLETTADFAVDNPFVTWILGGLNFQVEHHIFPVVSHLHYPAIQKIVKKYCSEKGLPYHEEKTILGAIRRHVAHLKEMSIPAAEAVIKSCT